MSATPVTSDTIQAALLDCEGGNEEGGRLVDGKVHFGSVASRRCVFVIASSSILTIVVGSYIFSLTQSLDIVENGRPLNLLSKTCSASLQEWDVPPGWSWCQEDSGCLATSAEFLIDNVLKQDPKTWNSSKVAYQHRPNSKWPVDKLWTPDGFFIDCSGFVSWMIKFGSRGGPCAGQKVLDEVGRLGGWPNNFKGRSKARPQASAFATSFTKHSTSWIRVTKARHIKRGDILAYKKREEPRYPITHNLGGIDSGHMVMVLDIDKGTVNKKIHCKINGEEKRAGYFRRYRMVVADSTSKMHDLPDTRQACLAELKKDKIQQACPSSSKKFAVGSCPHGCGPGKGVMYMWADPDSKVVAVSMGSGKATPKVCPPYYNLATHDYAVGRVR